MNESPIALNATMEVEAFHHCRELVRQLPLGETLCFTQVSWDEYEKLVENFNEGGAVRVSYDHGRLEIHRPLLVHAYLYRFTFTLPH